MTELESLGAHSRVHVRQLFEIAELVGFESRNKYAVVTDQGFNLFYAAEQQKGFLGLLWRQLLGHWRSFEILVFTADRRLALTLKHPFRFYFKRIEVKSASGQMMGAVEKEFSILTKKFQILDGNNQPIFQMRSPIWKIWSFPVYRQGQEVAKISKKWTGLGAEMFTDKDRFIVEFGPALANAADRALILAAALFVDLLYFERKAGR